MKVLPKESCDLFSPDTLVLFSIDFFLYVWYTGVGLETELAKEPDETKKRIICSNIIFPTPECPKVIYVHINYLTKCGEFAK